MNKTGTEYYQHGSHGATAPQYTDEQIAKALQAVCGAQLTANSFADICEASGR